MKTKKVIVEGYDSQWKSDFEKIKLELESLIVEDVVSIEHVGSTSVDGLSAKPIIDIDIIIDSMDKFPTVKQKLSVLGYIHEGNLGIEGREAFKYKEKKHLKTHHLYVCPKDSVELQRHLSFRNYLRSNSKAMESYSEIKKKGAVLYPNDIEKYIDYKSPIIEKIYAEIKKEGVN